MPQSRVCHPADLSRYIRPNHTHNVSQEIGITRRREEREITSQESSDCLENNGSDLFPDIPWWDNRNFRLLGCWDTSDEVHLIPPANLSLFEELVTKVYGEEDGNIDI